MNEDELQIFQRERPRVFEIEAALPTFYFGMPGFELSQVTGAVGVDRNAVLPKTQADPASFGFVNRNPV